MTHEEFMQYYTIYSARFANNAESGLDIIKVPDFHKDEVSFEQGFTGLYSNGQNKKFVRRGQMNDIIKVVSDLYYYIQHGGILTFEESVSRYIGGYPKGAILSYYKEGENEDDVGTFFRVMSLKENNTDNYIKNPAYIDGKSWTMMEQNIFPWYEKMETGTWSNDLEWTAPYDCWVYFRSTAFQSAVLFISKQGGVELPKWIKVAETTYLNTLKHGHTCWSNQFLCSKGDTFVCDLMPNDNTTTPSKSIYQSYNEGGGQGGTGSSSPTIAISYCPLRS